MRKLHLLMAEWRMDQRLRDERAYKLMSAFGWKPAEGGTVADIFPTLADAESESPEELSPDESDERIIFQEAAEALLP